MQQQFLPRRQRSRSLHTNKPSQIIPPPQLYKFKKTITQIMPKTPINQNLSNRNINSTNRHVGNGSSSPSTTSQACAACKYQRRKCASDCILAPYFPHHRQRQFQNAHKLFGVSNITKILKALDPFQKEEAMRTIIFQSDVRATDPVGGCYRIIRDLQRQIEYSKAELDIVLHQLAICKAQAQQQEQNDHFHPHDREEEEDPLHVLSQQYHQYLQQQHSFNQEPYVQIDQNHDQIVYHDLKEDLSSLWGMQESLQSSSSISSTTLHAKESLLPEPCSSIEGYDLDHHHPPPPPPPPHHHHDHIKIEAAPADNYGDQRNNHVDQLSFEPDHHHDQQKDQLAPHESEGSLSITKSR